MNGPRGTGAMERVAREQKETLINTLADKPPEVITYAMWCAFYDTAQAIAKADFLSHIDSVVKKYPAMTYSMIKELKDI